MARPIFHARIPLMVNLAPLERMVKIQDNKNMQEIKMGDFWTEKQKQDIAFFDENLETWAKNPLYKFKFVIISGKELKGIYDTFEAALEAAVVSFKIGEFIIQQIILEDETVSFLYPALGLLA